MSIAFERLFARVTKPRAVTYFGTLCTITEYLLTDHEPPVGRRVIVTRSAEKVEVKAMRGDGRKVDHSVFYLATFPGDAAEERITAAIEMAARKAELAVEHRANIGAGMQALALREVSEWRFAIINAGGNTITLDNATAVRLASFIAGLQS